MAGRAIHDIEIHRALQQAGIEATPANVAQARQIWEYAGGNLTDVRFAELLQQELGGAGAAAAPPPEAVGYDPNSGWELTADGQWIKHEPGLTPGFVHGPPPSLGPTAPTPAQPLGDTVDQAQGVDPMSAFLDQLLGGGAVSVDRLLAQLAVMESMGVIIPEALGVADYDEFRRLIQTGEQIPTVSGRLTDAQIELMQRQAALEEARLELQRLLGLESLELQRELGFADIDLRRELAALDAELQRELQVNQHAIDRELATMDADLQRELQGNYLEFQREELGFRQEQQLFEETMVGFRRAATPGLTAGKVSTTLPPSPAA